MKFKKYTEDLNITSIFENWKKPCEDCGQELEMPLMEEPFVGQPLWAWCDLCQQNIKLGEITALIVDLEFKKDD